MSRYELLLFIHIAAVIIWLGAGFMLAIQAQRAISSGDDARLGAAVIDSGQLATVLFIPASLATFVFDGGFNPASLAESRRLLMLGRIDQIVLFVVVADMAMKPTGDDVALLIAMAVVILAGAAWIVSRARAIEVPSTAEA